MTPFHGKVCEIISGVKEEDLHPSVWAFRLYWIMPEDQGRIYIFPKEDAHKDIYDLPPERGRFVNAVFHPQLKQVCFGFSEFPHKVGKSRTLTMLTYEEWEHHKAQEHIVAWIMQGRIPVADLETRKDKNEKADGSV